MLIERTLEDLKQLSYLEKGKDSVGELNSHSGGESVTYTVYLHDC